MHVHHFKINEIQRRGKQGVLHHVRRFWHLYRGKRADDARGLGEWHVETIIRRPVAEFAARFHVGNAGSETPFDGHLILFGSGIFWGTSWGRKIAQRLTTSEKHKYDGRDLAVSIRDGHARFSLWVPGDRWERGEFPRWREFSFRTNPADIIWGSRRYSYETLATALIAIDMPEATYAVRAELQRSSYGRPKSKRTPIRGLVLDVEAPRGIPNHHDHSGGWKGDRVYGFGVPMKDRSVDETGSWSGWEIDAQNAITARIYQDRANSGFRQAQEVDA